MKPMLALLVVLLLGMGPAHGATRDDVWVTVDATGYRLLQAIQPGLHPEAIRRQASSAIAKVGMVPRTEYVVRVSPQVRDRLAQAVHRERRHCGGFLAHGSLLAALTALNPASLAFTPTRPDYGIDRQPVVLPMLPGVSDTRIGDDIQSLSAFHNRYYDSSYGAQAADWLVGQWQAIAAARSDIQVQKVFRGSDAMPSVVLRIDGTSQPEQVLVIGAHLDSINHYDRDGYPVAQARAPGADDDASGVASVTELLRALVAHDFRPQRSIHLMAYSGEEMGLLGSKFIAADYASRQVDVVGVLQLDMTDYQGSLADIVIIDDDTDAPQNAFLENLVGAYLPSLVVDHDVCGYACSDHAAWTARGYAASFPFEARMGEDNPRIHWSTDTWANLGSQAVHAQKFTRLAVAWAVELAGDDSEVIFANGFDPGLIGGPPTSAGGP